MPNTPGMTDKSPQILRKTDPSQDESMSLTPSTYEGGMGKWQLTQKSYLTANNVSTISNNNNNLMMKGATD